MKATTPTFKQIMASGNARDYLVKIDLTLADETELELTEADIWDGSFSIDTASSGTSSFDIGTAVIGQCKFALNNFDERFNQYDFFNATATVWIKLVGDTQYYRIGFFTVDEPTYANALISLVLLDNMWKFDVPLSEAGITFTSSSTCRSIVNAMCSHCGVTLATQNFHGYDFPLTQGPDNADDMNCRELLQYIAMIGCNFCVIDDTGALNLKWYQQTDVANFSRNFNTSIGTDEITITGVKFVIDNTEHRIGTDGYVLELSNPLVNEGNVNTVLNLIWDVLEGFTLRTFNATTISDLSVEVGDRCKVTDYKGNEYYSWVTFNSFGLSNHMVQCNAIPPQRTLVKRYSKAVQAAVEEARRQTNQVISNYDLAVQMMNNLAVNAMGGYEEYQDLTTGGRVWYLSNRPITKNPTTGVCTFESGSTVYKKSGDGFFVSRDGGTTWVNGYNMSTGELVVNVLDAIGINAEWINTGTLTVGGATAGTQNPVIEVKDASNNTIVTINTNGITMYKGLIQSPDYAEKTPVGIYSQTGMMIDVVNKILKSPYFAINSNGAYFNGTIQINGDIELGSLYRFRPTEYYLATDFRLQFQAAEEYEGTSTVEIVKHYFTEVQGEWEENTDTVDTLTLTDDEPELSSLLDHTVGQNDKDYYAINITSSSSITTIIKDAILAYVGREGFKGFLEGIFKGYLESEAGKIAGFRYGSGTSASYVGGSSNGLFRSDNDYEFSMVDGFFRPNGALLRLYDNAFNFGNSDGHFRFFQSDSQGEGANSNSIAIQTGSNEISIKKFDSNYVMTGKVLWSDDITYSTQDITAGSTTLAEGKIYLVYE